MQRKTNVKLPQKTLMTKVEFPEAIPCRLHVAMQGKDYDKLTPEELKKNEVPHCIHKVWPPMSDICISCIGRNKATFGMVDKKGRTYRLVDPNEKKPESF